MDCIVSRSTCTRNQSPVEKCTSTARVVDLAGEVLLGGTRKVSCSWMTRRTTGGRSGIISFLHGYWGSSACRSLDDETEPGTYKYSLSALHEDGRLESGRASGAFARARTWADGNADDGRAIHSGRTSTAGQAGLALPRMRSTPRRPTWSSCLRTRRNCTPRSCNCFIRGAFS